MKTNLNLALLERYPFHFAVSLAPTVTVDAPPAAVFSKKVYLARKQDLELRCTTNNNYGKTKNGNGNDDDEGLLLNNNNLAKKFMKFQSSNVVWLKDGAPISNALTENDDFVIVSQRYVASY